MSDSVSRPTVTDQMVREYAEAEPIDLRLLFGSPACSEAGRHIAAIAAELLTLRAAVAAPAPDRDGWRLEREQPGVVWQLVSPSGAHAGWIYDSSLAEFRVLLAGVGGVPAEPQPDGEWHIECSCGENYAGGLKRQDCVHIIDRLRSEGHVEHTQNREADPARAGQ